MKVLKRFSGLAVVVRGAVLVSERACETAARDTHGCQVARGTELSEGLVGVIEPRDCSRRALLGGMRLRDDELRVSDLLEEVRASGEQLERGVRMGARCVRAVGTEVHLRERRRRLRD